MDELTEYLERLSGLIGKMQPVEIKKLTRELGKTMRKRNAERIAAQKEPSGEMFVERQSDMWKFRRLGKDESIKPWQKFYFLGTELQKKRLLGHKYSRGMQYDLRLSYVKDMGTHFVGKEMTNGNEPFKASGFRKEFIFLKKYNANKAMFRKMKNGKWLRYTSNEHQAAIGFFGGLIAKIATEHQYGNPKENLPSRELIGFSDDDLRLIEETIIEHLEK